MNGDGKLDDEVSVISSEVGIHFRLIESSLREKQQNRKFYNDRFGYGSKRIASEGWHAEYVHHVTLCSKRLALTDRQHNL